MVLKRNSLRTYFHLKEGVIMNTLGRKWVFTLLILLFYLLSPIASWANYSVIVGKDESKTGQAVVVRKVNSTGGRRFTGTPANNGRFVAPAASIKYFSPPMAGSRLFAAPMVSTRRFSANTSSPRRYTPPMVNTRRTGRVTEIW